MTCSSTATLLPQSDLGESGGEWSDEPMDEPPLTLVPTALGDELRLVFDPLPAPTADPRDGLEFREAVRSSLESRRAARRAS